MHPIAADGADQPVGAHIHPLPGIIQALRLAQCVVHTGRIDHDLLRYGPHINRTHALDLVPQVPHRGVRFRHLRFECGGPLPQV